MSNLTMDKLKLSALKKGLQVSVKSDLPGRLRLAVRHAQLIPEDSRAQAIIYVEKALRFLKGIDTVEVNPKIGTVLIHYQPELLTKTTILRWIDIVIEELATHLPDLIRQGLNRPQELETFFESKLAARITKIQE